MKLFFNLLAAALVVEGVSGQCSLCPGGSSKIIDSSRKLHYESCGQIESRLASTPSMICEITVDGTNFYWDHSAYCCSDVQPSFQCSLCDDGYFVAPSDMVKGVPENAVAGNCGEAYTHAVYAESSTACNMIKDAGMSACCSPSSTTRPPTTPSPTPPPTSIPTSAPTSAPSEGGDESIEPIVNPINAQQQQGQPADGASGVSFILATAGVLATSWFVIG